MLKLTYTPTSEIKESDLVPGSKWRRVRDESGPLKESYECVMVQGTHCKEVPHAILKGTDLLCHDQSTFQSASDMLTWLRRDFERVGGGDVREMKSVGLVPVGNLFVFDKRRYIKGRERNVNRDSLICWGLGHSGTSCFGDSTIVRDLGPIEIDDSVKGVG